MQDIQFNDANINGYQDIPSSLYPPLSPLNVQTATGQPSDGIAVSSVTINHQAAPIIGTIIPDTTGIFATWQYPVTDDLLFRVAVGYQFQVLEGTFTADQSQGIVPPGPVVFEQIVNLNSNPNPPDRYINLQAGAQGMADIPPSSLQPGDQYTVRVRALVFSELGAGTIGGQYFKYTQWGVSNFSINNVPRAINLRVNGFSNPTRLLNATAVAFSFTFSDTDGPAYLYRIQVGTTPGVGFAANIWDSGLISGGAAIGPKDFTVSFTGSPLQPNVLYAWRVQVQDSLSDGGFTDANDTFSINALPIVSSIKIDGNETLFNENPMVGNAGALLTWAFSDAQGDTQRAYSLNVFQIVSNGGQIADQFEILSTGDVFSSASSVALPMLPAGGQIQVQLSVRDSVEFGQTFKSVFSVNASPVVQNLLVEGKPNPGDVSSTTPAFSWTFFDDTPGDMQVQFRIQVGTDATFGTLEWDSGPVTSASNSVIYGSTFSPVVLPVPLIHGSYYYVRVQASDGVSFSEYATAFFSINTAPNSPNLLTPSAGAFSGNLLVTWLPASPLDADGDPVTYSIEMTSRRSSNREWEFIAGPFPSNSVQFQLDLSAIPSGNDYGVRVIANDGFADSDPTAGTSPLNGNGLGFTILNHAPSTPIFLSPSTGDQVSSIVKGEWLEADPVDVDGDAVFYILELTRDASVGTPVYETLNVFNEGQTKTLIDVSNLPDGSNYRLRITAKDDRGGVGQTNYSGIFSIINTAAVTDFEALGTNLYVGTSDGRVFKAAESIWQVDEDFATEDSLATFEGFVRGAPVFSAKDGVLSIQSPPGSTFILKVGPKPN